MKTTYLDSLSDKKFQNAWDDMLYEAHILNEELQGYYCTIEDFTR